MHVVSRVQPNQVMMVWPHLQREIRRGLEKGAGDTLTETGLFDGVANGDLDLWIVQQDGEILGGMFLQIVQRARGKALIVLDVVAGTGHGFKDYAREMLPRIREYGEMIGAYTIESVSRPGAARLLTGLGCKPKAMIMELRDGRTD